MNDLFQDYMGQLCQPCECPDQELGAIYEIASELDANYFQGVAKLVAQYPIDGEGEHISDYLLDNWVTCFKQVLSDSEHTWLRLHAVVTYILIQKLYETS